MAKHEKAFIYFKANRGTTMSGKGMPFRKSKLHHLPSQRPPDYQSARLDADDNRPVPSFAPSFLRRS